MKKLILAFAPVLLLTMNANVNAQTTNPSPYCSAGYDDGDFAIDVHLSDVSFATLNNNTGTQYPGKHYVFYNNISATPLKKDSTYTLSIKHSNGAYHFVIAYIDYNQNGDFNDIGERVFIDSNNGPFVNPLVSNVTIPADAKDGVTRMRVMIFEDDVYTFTPGAHGTPCTADTLDWGETEDYAVKIGDAASVNELAKPAVANIFPNPANNYINIDAALLGADIVISDFRGVTILKQKVVDPKLNISGLSTGIYMIKIISKDKVYIQKLLKEG